MFVQKFNAVHAAILINGLKTVIRQFFCFYKIGDKMKALTIKEPWASLIVEGYKKYEFRSWKTNYRGKILIHAGNSIEKDTLKRFESYGLNILPGYIIGEAELTNCILVDKQFNEQLRNIDPIVYGKSNHTETYAWKLGNIIKYDKPIPIKGKLGLWNYKNK